MATRVAVLGRVLLDGCANPTFRGAVISLETDLKTDLHMMAAVAGL